jgi:hypothetical protein
MMDDEMIQNDAREELESQKLEDRMMKTRDPIHALYIIHWQGYS